MTAPTKLSISRIRALLFVGLVFAAVSLVGLILLNVLDVDYFEHRGNSAPRVWYNDPAGLQLVYPLRAFCIIIRFVLPPLTFLLLLMVLLMLGISFYDRHRLVSHRFLKLLKFVTFYKEL